MLPRNDGAEPFLGSVASMPAPYGREPQPRGASAQRAGVDTHKRITPHALRHSYAIDLLLGDMDHGRPAAAPLPAVSKVLGRFSLRMSERAVGPAPQLMEFDELIRISDGTCAIEQGRAIELRG